MIWMLVTKLRKSEPEAPPAPELEKAPVLVEGSTSFTGIHEGVQYWIYFENGQARVEIEMVEEITAPFMADRRAGKPEMPGDARDHEVAELFGLRALYVEAGAGGHLIAAQFKERVLNANVDTALAPCPIEAAANKVVELLAGIREKSGQAPGDPAAAAGTGGNS